MDSSDLLSLFENIAPEDAGLMDSRYDADEDAPMINDPCLMGCASDSSGDGDAPTEGATNAGTFFIPGAQPSSRSGFTALGATGEPWAETVGTAKAAGGTVPTVPVHYDASCGFHTSTLPHSAMPDAAPRIHDAENGIEEELQFLVRQAAPPGRVSVSHSLQGGGSARNEMIMQTQRNIFNAFSTPFSTSPFSGNSSSGKADAGLCTHAGSTSALPDTSRAPFDRLSDDYVRGKGMNALTPRDCAARPSGGAGATNTNFHTTSPLLKQGSALHTPQSYGGQPAPRGIHTPPTAAKVIYTSPLDGRAPDTISFTTPGKWFNLQREMRSSQPQQPQQQLRSQQLQERPVSCPFPQRTLPGDAPGASGLYTCTPPHPVRPSSTSQCNGASAFVDGSRSGAGNTFIVSPPRPYADAGLADSEQPSRGLHNGGNAFPSIAVRNSYGGSVRPTQPKGLVSAKSSDAFTISPAAFAHYNHLPRQASTDSFPATGPNGFAAIAGGAGGGDLSSPTGSTPHKQGSNSEATAVVELLSEFDLDAYVRDKQQNSLGSIEDNFFVFDEARGNRRCRNFEIKEQILNTMKDQQGCRTLQMIIENRAHVAAATASAAPRGSPRSELGELVSDENAYTIIIAIVITTHLEEVMCHPYGNFLAQRLFYHFTPRSKRVLLIKNKNFQWSLGTISCSPHGTFAIQKFIEEIYSGSENGCGELSAAVIESKYYFAQSILQSLQTLLLNINGGHVLMKWLHFLADDYKQTHGAGAASAAAAHPNADQQQKLLRQFQSNVTITIYNLFEKVKLYFIDCCRDKQGCCTMQKCLDFFAAMATASRSVSGDAAGGVTGHGGLPNFQPFEALVESSFFQHESCTDGGAHAGSVVGGGGRSTLQLLSADPYGNYVVTHIVQQSFAKNFTRVLDEFSECFLTNNRRSTPNDILFYCTNKYASNIVESVLRYQSKNNNQKYIRQFCAELLMPLGGSQGRRLLIQDIALHNYGNYVIQTLLTVAPTDILCNTMQLNGCAISVLGALMYCLPSIREKSFGKKFEAKIDMANLRATQFAKENDLSGTDNAPRFGNHTQLLNIPHN